MQKTLEVYNNCQEYLADLNKRAILPKGFNAGTADLNFFPKEKALETSLKMTLSLIKLDSPTSVFGGVFTKNKIPGAPVLIGKELLNKELSSGVIINNKIANVCTPGGIESANRICRVAESYFDLSDGLLFPASTGIIGWSLPEEEILKAIPEIDLKSDSIMTVAEGIMTTDSFPKIRSIELNGGRITAIAKGAGMIEPNMATMLVYILTDLKVGREEIRSSLRKAVDLSFNRITVDSDQSTSDMALIFSSCQGPDVRIQEFQGALNQLCSDLAEDIVRNGEGAKHVIEVDVQGFTTAQLCNDAAKHLCNSPLLKCAIFGNDPNVGRIIQSLGDWAGMKGVDIDTSKLEIHIGGYRVFEAGVFFINDEIENELYTYLKERELNGEGYPSHNKTVQISITYAKSNSRGLALGSDLSYDYVKENADYRS